MEKNLSRIIGRVFANDKEFCINQSQRRQSNGEYEIQDKEKRADFEAEKKEQNLKK